MAVGAIIGIIATTIAGAVANGVTAGVENQKKVDAYQNAASSVRNAAEKYSGKGLYDRMTTSGLANARNNNSQRLEALAGNVSGPTAASSAKLGSDNITNTSNTLGDFNTGASNAASLASGHYNNTTAQAQQLMNQADINYKANTEAVAGGLETLGDAAKTIKNVSDVSEKRPLEENEKTSVNNNSGLPHADIQDSLRQIESIMYKYKHPEKPGEDDEVHVGTTAQSLEKTDLFGDTVAENEEGIKRVDQWRLLESITSASAELQREIDELQADKSNKNINGENE